MTESAPPAALSPVDEARVSFALHARKLAEHAYALIPLNPGAPRSEGMRRVLALCEILGALIDRAAVTEREEGSTCGLSSVQPPAPPATPRASGGAPRLPNGPLAVGPRSRAPAA